MKNTIPILGGAALSLLVVSAMAQQTQTWDARKNPTVDSITSRYKGKLLPSRPTITTEQVFPVLGQYESSSNAEIPVLKITLDEQNKGLVWIDGLPKGKIKAMLRRSPATYKIPAQKTDSGIDVEEGTLIYDKDNHTLSICIGKAYNAQDPAAAFAPTPEEVAVADPKPKSKTAKTKTTVKPKPWMYVGTKIESSTAMTQ